MIEKLGHERAALLRELEAVIANSNVISYLHVGRPETILIDDAGRVAAQLQEIAARIDYESDSRAATPTE